MTRIMSRWPCLPRIRTYSVVLRAAISRPLHVRAYLPSTSIHAFMARPQTCTWQLLATLSKLTDRLRPILVLINERHPSMVFHHSSPRTNIYPHLPTRPPHTSLHMVSRITIHLTFLSTGKQAMRVDPDKHMHEHSSNIDLLSITSSVISITTSLNTTISHGPSILCSTGIHQTMEADQATYTALRRGSTSQPSTSLDAITRMACLCTISRNSSLRAACSSSDLLPMPA